MKITKNLNIDNQNNDQNNNELTNNKKSNKFSINHVELLLMLMALALIVISSFSFLANSIDKKYEKETQRMTEVKKNINILMENKKEINLVSIWHDPIVIKRESLSILNDGYTFIYYNVPQIFCQNIVTKNDVIFDKISINQKEIKSLNSSMNTKLEDYISECFKENIIMKFDFYNKQ